MFVYSNQIYFASYLCFQLFNTLSTHNLTILLLMSFTPPMSECVAVFLHQSGNEECTVGYEHFEE